MVSVTDPTKPIEILAVQRRWRCTAFREGSDGGEDLRARDDGERGGPRLPGAGW
jgi:hypothetical protein